MLRAFVLFAALLGLATPLAADPLEDGQEAIRKANYATALKLLRPPAEEGNANAQISIGNLYLYGFGVPRDYREAMKWFRKAADQGNLDGQLSVGNMYAWGFGVPRDHGEAVRWYRLAADEGNALARTYLGHHYRDGLGVPQDLGMAFKWYRLAAEQGVSDAQYQLGEMYSKGDGIPPDPDEAMKWYRKAAEQGDRGARNRLQMMLDQQEDSVSVRDSGVLSGPLLGARGSLRAVKRLLLDPGFLSGIALFGAFAYPFLLWGAIRTMKGGWRWFAYATLPIMVSLLAYTAVGMARQSVLVIIPALFVVPPVLLYQVSLFIVHATWKHFRSTRPTPRGRKDQSRSPR